MPDNSDTQYTGYLVVPAYAGDRGVRPLSSDAALHNLSLQVLDQSGQPAYEPVAGTSYTLVATVANLGAARINTGTARFYCSADSSGTPTLHAATSFQVGSGGIVQVICPTPWTPKDHREAVAPVLVNVYDSLLDPVARPNDYAGDRHVGCRAPYCFSGKWWGEHTFVGAPGPTNLTLLISEPTVGNQYMIEMISIGPVTTPYCPGAKGIASRNTLTYQVRVEMMVPEQPAIPPKPVILGRGTPVPPRYFVEHYTLTLIDNDHLTLAAAAWIVNLARQ